MFGWVPLASAGCTAAAVATYVLVAAPRKEATPLADAIAIIQRTPGRRRWLVRMGRLLSDRAVAATLYALGLGGAVLIFLETTFAVPAEYSYLRTMGIVTTAIVSSCNGAGLHTSCDVVFSVRGRAQRHTLLDFQTDLPPGTPLTVVVDPGDASQVYAEKDVKTGKDADSPLLIAGSALIVGMTLVGVRGVTHRPWLWPLRGSGR